MRPRDSPLTFGRRGGFSSLDRADATAPQALEHETLRLPSNSRRATDQSGALAALGASRGTWLSAEHNLHGHNSSCASVNNHTQIIAGIAPWLNPSFSSRSGSSSTTLGACWPSWRWPRCTGCAESGRGTLSTLELRTCFELPATHGWAAQLYLHPTTDRLGSPAAPPSTATGDPLITAAAIGRYRGLSA